MPSLVIMALLHNDITLPFSQYPNYVFTFWTSHIVLKVMETFSFFSCVVTILFFYLKKGFVENNNASVVSALLFVKHLTYLLETNADSLIIYLNCSAGS